MNDPQERYQHSLRQEMLQFIPVTATRILDVGCYSGAFGEFLKRSRQVEVWGVEPNAVAAEKAKAILDHVFNQPFSTKIELPEAYFDVIVMNDVLEHMNDPWAALELAKQKLSKDGRIVVSIPNFRQIDNLLHVLCEKDFRYEATGILDSTHLRFFTRKSAIRLINDCGLEVEHIEGINETWCTKSIGRRLAYRLFGKMLEDTKYLQYAIVARICQPIGE